MAYLEAAKVLLDAGESPNHSMPESVWNQHWGAMTPLLRAVHAHCAPMVKLLVSRGGTLTNLKPGNFGRCSAIATAPEDVVIELFDSLEHVEGMRENIIPKLPGHLCRLLTPQHVAPESPRVQLLRRLLSTYFGSASIDVAHDGAPRPTLDAVCSVLRTTPLSLAASAVASLLLEAGASIDYRCDLTQDRTALMFHCAGSGGFISDKLPKIQCLLDNGASVSMTAPPPQHIRESCGALQFTALLFVISIPRSDGGGHVNWPAAVQALLDAGADVDALCNLPQAVVGKIPREFISILRAEGGFATLTSPL